MRAIRGATFVENDSFKEIEKATLSLMSEIFSKNSLEDDEVVSTIFSVTKDLRSANPATIFRRSGHDVPLMCFQEADFERAPQRVIRVIVFVQRTENSYVKNVYKNGADILKEWKWNE